jgi:hypothetical protein
MEKLSMFRMPLKGSFSFLEAVLSSVVLRKLGVGTWRREDQLSGSNRI